MDSPASPIRIDTLSPDDWRRVREIRLATLQDAPYAFGSTYAGELEQPEDWWRQRLVDGQWVVATDGQRDLSVAMLTYGPLPDTFTPNGVLDLPPDADVPWIRAVWTRPEARGRKLVDLLCLHLCDVAAAQGSATVVLGVRAGNDRAHSAYLRMGFADIGTFIPASNPAEHPNHLMARWS